MYDPQVFHAPVRIVRVLGIVGKNRIVKHAVSIYEAAHIALIQHLRIAAGPVLTRQEPTGEVGILAALPVVYVAAGRAEQSAYVFSERLLAGAVPLRSVISGPEKRFLGRKDEDCAAIYQEIPGQAVDFPDTLCRLAFDDVRLLQTRLIEDAVFDPPQTSVRRIRRSSGEGSPGETVSGAGEEEEGGEDTGTSGVFICAAVLQPENRSIMNTKQAAIFSSSYPPISQMLANVWLKISL